MKRQLTLAMCAAITVATSTAVLADSWWDDGGRGRYRSEYRVDSRDGYAQERREFKEEFYDRGCKVEREWRRDGTYKEEVKCERRH